MKVHTLGLYKAEFGYTVAVDGRALPMDVAYAEALEWFERLQVLGCFETRLLVQPPKDEQHPVTRFASLWKDTQRWLIRRGLTVLEGPVGVDEIARLLVWAESRLTERDNGGDRDG